MSDPPEHDYDVFLSHASEDKPWCETFATQLRDRGVRVWFDKWEMKPGDHLEARLDDGLKKSRKMIAVWSKNYFRNGKVWTLAEAYSRQHSDILARQRPLIPVLIETCDISPIFSSIIFVDFRNKDDFDLRFRELVNSLDLPQRQSHREERFDHSEIVDRLQQQRLKLIKMLNALPVQQFDMLVFGINPPPELIPPNIAPLGDRTFALLNWAEGTGGCGLSIIEEALEEILGQSPTGSLEPEILPLQSRDKDFEIEVAELYRLLGYESVLDAPIDGGQINLTLKKKEAGVSTHIILECREKRIAARERESILKRHRSLHERLKRHQWIAVSAQGFDLDSQSALEEAGITCVTYSELLGELAPLGEYVNGLISDYETWRTETWEGQDRFIRPNLITDITYEERAALAHFAEWLDNPRAKQLVILGDLGTGKTTLASFLAYDLAQSFKKDPLRHPAPVLIPLKEVRKRVDLEGIVTAHFNLRQHPIANFRRYEYLIRKGKIITIFDAFDEMADRVKSEVTRDNYRQLARVAQLNGKFILTCRTHYFKDRTEQVKLIDQALTLSSTETELYRELRKQTGAVVYLQEFGDEQILAYLQKTRPDAVDEDWKKIQEIHNLRELANRPLLLDMIVKSLNSMSRNEEINAANLYTVYTNLWIVREEEKERLLSRLLNDEGRLELMIELAWNMWLGEKSAVHYGDLVPFVKKLVSDKVMDFGDEDAEDIAGEMRAATFLKRDDHGNFSFAHRSFMEYFLARKIHKSIADADKLTEILNTRRFDQKIVFFLTLIDKDDIICEHLQRILAADYSRNVSENALQILYWSGRIREKMEEKIEDIGKLRSVLAARIPAGAKLAGANLQEMTLEAADLTDANLSKADLTKANLNNAYLLRSDLSEAVLTEARIENISAVAVDFRRADLSKASFIGASIENCDFTDAKYERKAFVSAAYLQNNRGLVVKEAPRRGIILPVVQLGHSGGANAVAYSPNGELIASGADDGLINLYRAVDGKLLHVLEGHQDRVWSVAFSPDGKTIASGGYDKSVRLWDAASGCLIHSLQEHKNWVMSVAFSPDGKMIASAGYDKSVRLWDAESGCLIRSLQGYQDRVWSVAFSPDGKTIVGAGYDKSVRLWDAESGSLIRSLQGHESYVRSVAFSPDGKTIASASADQSVKLWDAESGSLIRSLQGHQNLVMSVAFSPDGKTIASTGYDQSIRLWDVSTGSLIRSLQGHQDYVMSVAFSPDGKTIVSAGHDQSVRLWDVSTGSLIRSLQGHQDYVMSVAFSSDGKVIAGVGAGADTSVRLWDAASGSLIHSLQGHQKWVRSVAFSPDSKTIASASYDTSVKLWDAASGSSIRSLQGHQNWVRSVAFSPDGKTIASAGDDQSVRLWDAASGSLIRSLQGHQNGVMSVAFSPDGKTIASTGNDKSVRLWDAASGSLIWSMWGHQNVVLSVAFSPDGKTIASASYDTNVKLWDATSGSSIRSLQGHQNGVMSVAFSPDGKTIASASDDKSVRLWDAESGSLIRSLQGHMGSVYAVGFAAVGKYLIAAGTAGRLQFWDYEKGDAFLYLYGFGPGAWLALLPDGRFDASPEGMRYLCYTEIGTLYSYTAEELQKKFYSPDAVRQALVARR